MVLLVLWLFIQRTRLGARHPRGVAGPGKRAVHGHPHQPHLLHRDGDLRRHRGAGRRAGVTVPHVQRPWACCRGESLRLRHRRRPGIDPGQPFIASLILGYSETIVAYLVSTSWTSWSRWSPSSSLSSSDRPASSDAGGVLTAADGQDRYCRRHRRRGGARARARGGGQQLSHRRADGLRDLRHLGRELGFHVRLTGREIFGHSLFIGAGAYTAGFLATIWFANPWYSLPASVVIAVAFSLIVGFPTLRLRGPYFALAMLSAGRRSCSASA